MIDSKKFRAFRKYNNLTQDEVAEFLGTKKAFISQIENGRVSLPEDKYYRLVHNDKGWDVSLLLGEEPKAEHKSSDPAVSLDSPLLAALREAQAQTTKSQEQIDRLLGIIEVFQNSQK